MSRHPVKITPRLGQVARAHVRFIHPLPVDVSHKDWRLVPEIVDIQISDLLLDLENPRFAEMPRSQQEAAHDLAEKHGEHILELARDIVEFGIDPTTLPAVIATGDTRKRYRMLEGNRRLLAIKALETPTLISGVLSPSRSKKLNELSKRYARRPVASMPCVLFASEKEAVHWVFIRHTGENKGTGLVTWGAEEKERYEARHTGRMRPAGQVIEFVEKHGTLSPAAHASRQRINTNVERLVETTYVREKLGIDIDDGDVISYYPLEEVVKGLTRIVEDLKTKAVLVPDLYHAEQRKTYVDKFTRGQLPKKKSALAEPVVLSDLTAGKAPRKVKPRPKPKPKKKPSRTAVVAGNNLNVTPPRINTIYNELLTLNAEQYPNACSVLLRVFIELSVDHLLTDKNVMTESKIRKTPLADRLKAAAGHFRKSGAIPAKLKKAVDTVADGHSILAPGMATFNQYVHNQFVFPKPSELYAAWDELAPLMEKVWP